ncbi:MAG: NUDIX hydrolase [Clostridia bacterium]|nr:NUDIX hydrolase [Clostridia bacterium]
MKDDQELYEAKVSSKPIYDGKVLHLFVDDVKLPDGKPAIREYVKQVNAVAVLPLTKEGEVLCVRQYRYAHEKVLLEIPAGKLDSDDEDPEVGARRELREETGAECAALTFLGGFIGSPAILTEVVCLYLAEGLSFHAPSPDEDEFLDVVRIPLGRLVDMVLSGEIEDGKTQTAILKVAELLRRRGEMA